MSARNKIITVFGSAYTLPEEIYYKEIEETGKLLAKAGFDVCSGGYGGVMEAVSKGAKLNGGNTIGITVATWKDRTPNQYVNEVVKMPNLMERITELITIADGYVILKGGTGTLVELSVTLELMNKRAMPEKPIVLYGDFWKNMIEILKQDSPVLNDMIERNVAFCFTTADIVSKLRKLLPA